MGQEEREGFFFIFKHSWAPKMSWKIAHMGPGKVMDFLSLKEWESCLNHTYIHNGYLEWPNVIDKLLNHCRDRV